MTLKFVIRPKNDQFHNPSHHRRQTLGQARCVLVVNARHREEDAIKEILVGLGLVRE